MAKINISKEIVLSIAKQDNSKFVEGVDEKVNAILSATIEKLSANNPYVNLDNVYLQPANELFSGAMLDNSSFVYLLGIENAQLELNTIKSNQFWKNFKERLKFAWENRKYFNRKKKRKKKKKKEDEIVTEIPELKIDSLKYNIYSLTKDLQDTIILYLSETSICYAQDNVLKIIGKDDFGANTQIIINVVSYEDRFFKRLKNKRKGFTIIDFDSRYAIFEEKYDRVGENYIKILKLFNFIYYNTNKTFPNQCFMESILNYCPDELFEGKDIYDVFVKIINFLYYKPLKEIKSVNDPTKSVLDDEVCENGNAFAYKKMLDAIASKEN